MGDGPASAIDGARLVGRCSTGNKTVPVSVRHRLQRPVLTARVVESVEGGPSLFGGHIVFDRSDETLEELGQLHLLIGIEGRHDLV